MPITRMLSGSPGSATARQHAPVSTGALRIADLGFWSLPVFRRIAAGGGYFLSRYHCQTSVWQDGARLDLPRWLAQQAPVVDVAATLVDGSFHSVDSSELAFRTAGRIAMSEALAAASPYLLEPVSHVTIMTPGSASSRITSAVASRRGQMLRMTSREGWSAWDVIEVLLPEAGLQGLEAEIRSMSQGMASFEAHFDHLAEVAPKLASSIVQRVKEPA